MNEPRGPLGIALPSETAERYGAEIEAVAPGRVRLLPVAADGSGLDAVSDAEIVLHVFWFGPPSIGEVMAAAPRARWLHSTGAGVDELVAAGLADREILVTNAAGPYAPAMAEYAVAAMVLLARNFAGWADAQLQRRWLPRLAPTGTPLAGKHVGIIGYGAVGRRVATACEALGMRVWASRRTPIDTAGEPLERWVPADELPELLAASDFLVVAASLNSTTRRLLGDAAFAAVKPGAFLVNVARGELVDHDALSRALRDGRLAGAVLDVTDPEPLPADSPLWTVPNVWITPHASGDTEEGWQRSIDLFCANLRLYLAGLADRMENIVDFAAHR